MAVTNATSLTELSRGPSPANGKAEASGDVERAAVAEAHLQNTTVRNLSWKGVTVTVKDRETKQAKVIVDSVEGIVEAG